MSTETEDDSAAGVVEVVGIAGIAGGNALLALQLNDTAIDQLRHQRANLPGHATLVEVQQQAQPLRTALTQATARRDEAAGRQTALEHDVAAAEKRKADINSRLYGTTPISPRDAQAMVEEVAHLDTRRRHLEDQELEVMEELEPLQQEVTELSAKALALGARLREAQAQIAEGETVIDADLLRLQLERNQLSAKVAAALLAEYERLRKALGGIGAAPLANGSCGGCHLAISATELHRITTAPADAIVHCDECGRILVRK